MKFLHVETKTSHFKPPLLILQRFLSTGDLDLRQFIVLLVWPRWMIWVCLLMSQWANTYKYKYGCGGHWSTQVGGLISIFNLTTIILPVVHNLKWSKHYLSRTSLLATFLDHLPVLNPHTLWPSLEAFNCAITNWIFNAPPHFFD